MNQPFSSAGPKKSQKVPLKPVFSLVIVNYNSSDDLSLALRSFYACHLDCQIPFEVIIVDNGSERSQRQRFRALAQHFGDFASVQLTAAPHLISAPQNLGFAAANNLGAAQSKGDYLLFLNPDTICQEDLLTPFAAILARDSVGILAPQLTLPAGRLQHYAYGTFPSLGQLLCQQFVKVGHRLAPQLFPLTPPPPVCSRFASYPVSRQDWLSGACLAISKKHFQVLKGFDTSYFMYFEDVDFCHRAAQLNLKSYLLPELSLVHLGGARSSLTRARRRQYFAAQKQYFRTWHPFQLPFLLFLRLPYQLYCYYHDQS